MIPQIIYVALALIGLGMEIEKHGQLKIGKHNAISTLIALTIVFALLYWGGFFDPLFR